MSEQKHKPKQKQDNSCIYETKIAVAVAGSVDASKSTTIGVLLYGELDDGSGAVRNRVAKHPHEKKSGQTSDISVKFLKCPDNKHGVSLIDLCGHDTYFRTTTRGLNEHFPDYGIVVIAANRGILKMTKEHLGILVYQNIPIIILITRTDLVAGTEIYKNTLKNVIKLCKNCGKYPITINTDKEFGLTEEDRMAKIKNGNAKIIELADKMQNDTNIVPIISTSNKTGYYIDTVREFLYNIKPRLLWDADTNMSIFYIDNVYTPLGIGVVFSGILRGKSLFVGDTVYLGPKNKSFIQLRIKSIHNDCKQEIQELTNHTRGCISVVYTDRDKTFSLNKNIYARGLVCITPKSYTENICYRFRAEIEILHHSVTIKHNYSPFLHIGHVSQSATLIVNEEVKKLNKNKDVFMTGDRAIVDFKFMHNPEFIELYSKSNKTFFIREGSMRALGKIIGITRLVDEKDKDDH